MYNKQQKSNNKQDIGQRDRGGQRHGSASNQRRERERERIRAEKFGDRTST